MDCGFASVAEGCFGLAGDGFGGLVAVGGDLQDAGRGGGQRGERGGDGGPVDAAKAGPEVLVLFLHVAEGSDVREGAVVVVQMHLGDARAEQFDGSADAGVLRRASAGMARCRWPTSRQTPTESKWPVLRMASRCSGVATSFCRFSSSRRTPSGAAKALRCSMAVSECSRACSSQAASLRPRWRTMAAKGTCSADSMARLTSSMAAMRWDFSAAIRSRLGATWRDHWAASALLKSRPPSEI